MGVVIRVKNTVRVSHSKESPNRDMYFPIVGWKEGAGREHMVDLVHWQPFCIA